MGDHNLQIIYKAVSKFLQQLTPEEMYKAIVEEGLKLVDTDYGSLFLKNDGGLDRVYTTLPEYRPIRKRGFTYQAFHNQEVLVKNAEQFGRYHPNIKKLGSLSNIFLPLVIKGESVGVLNINSFKTVEEAKKDISILQLYASLASLAIKKTQSFDETKKALETRDLFIAMAAHELRTPLTTIIGYVQLLKNRIPKDNSSESRWIYELSWEATRLSQLVNELLEVNRIKSGEFQYNFKESGMRIIINRALSNFQFSHPDREIVFIDQLDDKSDKVIGDFDKLLQVITNLVENAIKYSSSGKPVSITLRDKSSDVIIDIKDHGKGIAKKDISNIFDKFYRSNEHSIEGMGLGLHLVKNILDEHRGQIKIHSSQGKGTKVSVILPKAKLQWKH